MARKAGEWQACGLRGCDEAGCLCCVLAARSPVRLCLVAVGRRAGRVGALEARLGWPLAAARFARGCLSQVSLCVVARNP